MAKAFGCSKAGDSLRTDHWPACSVIVSYETVRRTHEIGIRMAWERAGPTFSALVMRQTVVVVTIGAGIGVACAGRGAVDRSMLFGIGPGDPLAIGAALAVLFSVALAAPVSPAPGVAARSDAGAQISVTVLEQRHARERDAGLLRVVCCRCR